MQKTVLVTGGAGFIGNYICRALLDNNYSVKVLDTTKKSKAEYITDIMPEISFVRGDITNLAMLKKEFRGIDYVLHQAALRSAFESVEIPHIYNKVNIEGTLNVLEAARHADVKRVVFASSSSVYGNCRDFPEKESCNPIPRSPYAISKLIGEHYCSMFYKLYGLETISLRYFNVFGPVKGSEEFSTIFPVFIKAMINNQRPVIWGDGTQSRDFTYVKNIADANIAAIEANKDACGEVFNISSGYEISINNVIERINLFLDKDIKPKYAKMKKGDVFRTCADISKAIKILGWEAKYSFDEGLRETISAYARDK